MTDSLDDPRPYSRDVSLDSLISLCAHDQCAAGIDGREEGVAVLETVFNDAQRSTDLVDHPFQLALLAPGFGIN